ncbi:50S ribosomal protein L25 [candidate division KSB3 bacterium]|jgi:large subunit ribosomal protein L25|uniref:Large ribosomal subunit protein bL25 n=1 Tax=candidate division KSB3 bacterium TaxID=2044937 RepID=A0A9D5Q816_9BACT|nr:50S ribosomal protein L25 [candidate division KSB3 bacterium]MBD3327464.1 50S ribosomal protein L25 [candidate division KSB3 bacterium]
MEQIQLTSHPRTETGKGVARKLRSQGLIPAILYGGEHGNTSLTVSSHDLRQIIAKGIGDNVLIDLAIEEDGSSQQKVVVILRDYQIDPVKQTLVHADFMEITMGRAIQVDVPLVLVGEEECPGVKEGGTVEFTTREVTVECLPSDLVDQVEVDVSALEIGDLLTVGDLHFGEKIDVLIEPDITVVTVSAPRSEEELEALEEGVAAEEEVLEPELIQKGKPPEEEGAEAEADTEEE